MFCDRSAPAAELSICKLLVTRPSVTHPATLSIVSPRRSMSEELLRAKTSLRLDTDRRRMLPPRGVLALELPVMRRVGTEWAASGEDWRYWRSSSSSASEIDSSILRRCEEG